MANADNSLLLDVYLFLPSYVPILVCIPKIPNIMLVLSANYCFIEMS